MEENGSQEWDTCGKLDCAGMYLRRVRLAQNNWRVAPPAHLSDRALISGFFIDFLSVFIGFFLIKILLCVLWSFLKKFASKNA